MKFINEKGKVEEGIPLTDSQFHQREMLVTYFHEKACHDVYHGVYGTKDCEELATAFVTGEIEAAANKHAEPESVPEIKVVEPISATVTLPSAEWQDEATKSESALGPF